MAAGNHDQMYQMQLKLLMVGESEVGKTCLIWKFAADQFSTTTMHTIGIDCKTKYVNMDDVKMKLQVWDTAGQERYNTITVSFFRGAHGIMLVYDVTSRRSFAAVRKWMEQIRLHADAHVNLVLIGNKVDMESKRAVRTEEGAKLAEEYNIPFFETSAKDSVGVKEAFFSLAAAAKHRILTADGTEEEIRPSSFRLVSKDKRKQSTCC